MRFALKNKRPMMYSLLRSVEPVYETDSEGNIIYDTIDGEQVPRDTGKTRTTYEKPVPFAANVNFSGQGEIRHTVYGMNKSQYDAIFYAMRGELPIDETSIIFVNAEPEYYPDGYVKLESADYRVVRMVESLNYMAYMIRKADRTSNEG